MSVASALKWSQRLRETGSAGSRRMGGYRQRVLASEQGWMLLRLEECPHLTVRGLAAELAERGYRVSPNTVWSLLRQAGHSFKKACSRAVGPGVDGAASIQESKDALWAKFYRSAPARQRWSVEQHKIVKRA